MTAMRTRAIHVVWTTYGTWLPGDTHKPGHWSPLFDMYGRLVKAGHRLNLPHAPTRERAQAKMKEEPFVLSAAAQIVVANTIGEILSPGGAGAQWILYAAAIEPTHVHLLFGPLRDDIGAVVGRIKSTTSAAVIAHDGTARARTWTAGYWKAFLSDEPAVCTATQYIEAHNLRRGRPASPYPWIAPPCPT